MSTIELYIGEYNAKFAREAKERPTDWLLKPAKDGMELHHIGASESEDTTRRRKLCLVPS